MRSQDWQYMWFIIYMSLKTSNQCFVMKTKLVYIFWISASASSWKLFPKDVLKIAALKFSFTILDCLLPVVHRLLRLSIKLMTNGKRKDGNSVFCLSHTFKCYHNATHEKECFVFAIWVTNVCQYFGHLLQFKGGGCPRLLRQAGGTIGWPDMFSNVLFCRAHPTFQSKSLRWSNNFWIKD